MPRHNVFSPSRSDGRLPYLDATIDVVIVEGDVLHAGGETAAAVEAIAEGSAGRLDGLPRSRVGREPLSKPSGACSARRRWRSSGYERVARARGGSTGLGEALAEEPGAYLVTSSDHDVVEHAETVVLIDEGVLPLPSCLSTARALLSGEQGIGGVAVKILDAHGSLEAAGTTLFADGSFAGVGSGSYDVAAPWHEYLRGTCWGAGLMVYKVDAVKEVIRERPSAGAQSLWAEKVWTAGYRVVYQPTATAVRVAPGAPVGVDASWALHLPGRPSRPLVLDEAAWRELLAVDDVAGGLR